MSSPLLHLRDREENPVAIPVDNIKLIIKDCGRAEVMLLGGGSVQTLEQYDYVTWAYDEINMESGQ